MKLNEIELGFGGGELLQCANRYFAQNMAYMIKTPDGKIVMIDGGHDCDEDGKYLYDLIKGVGGHVDAWFFTHAHIDHYGSLLWIMKNIEKFDIETDCIYCDFPPEEWFKTVENGDEYENLCYFLNFIKVNNIKMKRTVCGEKIEVGGMTFEILNDSKNYNNYSSINDSGICILAHFPKKSVLFLGDLGEEAGEYYLEHFDTSKLRCDIVQTAHHGQNGVNKKFYEYVMPKVCLYTAPDWLYENDVEKFWIGAGNEEELKKVKGGYNSGPWKTIETRMWMKDFGVLLDCPAAYGDYLLK